MKHRKLQFAPATVVLLILFCFAAAHAQITPSGDAYTNSATPTTNYGSKTLLDVDAASQITYIQFDLGSIPSGATVSQATLKLYVNSVTAAGSFNVDYVNGSWSEGTIDYSNAPALGSTIASNVEVAASEKNHYLLINVTPALVAWLNGSEANNGIALVANGSFNATFDSKENTGTSHPPELDVVFAGSGGTITGVLTGAGSGLMGGGTSGTLNLSLLNTCAANQVLQWNGSAWACASVGTGTITGVTAGTALTGGGSNGNVTLNVDTTQVPLLGAPNVFNNSQTVSGNLSATGVVTGSGYQIGSNLFAFGSFANSNAFLGFAGNTTMTGTNNTASGDGALTSNTTGADNTASGALALASNSAGADNTASGFAALDSNTTGSANTASGVYALAFNSAGTYNTASGYSGLYSNTSGNYNTASGYEALYANTTGGYNAASGARALFSNTTGADNTASGETALWQNTTGSYNAANGTAALASNTTGNQNTATGNSSGNTKDGTFLTGSGDSFLGAFTALKTGTLSNAAAVGANAEVDESNAMVLGSIAGVNGATASTNVGIGTTTPASTLDVHGTGNFTGLVTFAANQTFPGTGTITGVTAGTDLTGGGNSGSVTLNVDTSKVVTAVVAGTDLTGGGAGGVQTLNLDTTKVPQLAAPNTFTGNQTVNGNLSATGVVTGNSYQIGSNLFDYGSYANQDAFLGFAGNGTITGYANTAVGLLALHNNTSTGQFNTASGAFALNQNTTGSYNTASGYGALNQNTNGSYNTASGLNVLYYNTMGANNTASGQAALYLNTTGGLNTASGFFAGNVADRSNITGSSNTFMGVSTAMSTGTLNNATAIGANAEVDKSNAMVLGSINGVNSATADTYVGIGTTAPAHPLTVVTNSDYIPLSLSSSSTFGTWLQLGNSSAGGKTWNFLSAGGGNAEGAGNLGITTAGQGGTIYLEGNVQVTGNLSKGGGSFQIDHPLDPANKYLYHSFVESPDMMNVYNGNVTTDRRGFATVSLPEYFGALNRDFRYQLTVIGQFAQAIIARKIEHNRFVIRTSKPGVEVSWQVTGIRQDAYANAHRIPVEEDKTVAERGRYLHPELFGASRELAISMENSNAVASRTSTSAERVGEAH